MTCPSRCRVFTALMVTVFLVSALPALAQNVSVTAADPPSGEQDTVALVVRVTGRNFAQGAKADFFRSGTTNPSGIAVRSTTFVSSTQLDVTIDIAADAALSYFDVRVTNVNGRSGKGSDMFRVVEKGSNQLACFDDAYQLNMTPLVLDPGPGDAPCQVGVSGTLDCSFGTDGRVTTAANPSFGVAFDLAAQADGKLVAVLWGRPPNASSGVDFYVIRYEPDGDVDTAFGDNGIVRLSFTSQIDEEQARTIVVQPDGRILVGGSIQQKKPYGFKVGIARLLSDGSLDPTFGVGGKVMLSFASEKSHSWFRDLRLQRDGRVLAVGHTDDQFAAARLMPTGALDQSFASGGRLVLPSGRLGPAGTAVATSVGFQDVNGEEYPILVGASPTCSSAQTMGLVRLQPNGSIDPSFGPTGEGRVFVELVGRRLAPSELAVAADNSLVIGAYTESSALAVIRLDASGTPDPSFGTGGVSLVEVPGRYRILPAGIALDELNRIVIGGDTSVEGTTQISFLVVRLLSDGTPDTAFGSSGAVITNFDVSGGNDQARGMAIQPSGRIVLAGYATGAYVALAGYTP